MVTAAVYESRGLYRGIVHTLLCLLRTSSSA
jgi:hypothetical protein